MSLSKQHMKSLRASGIDDAVLAERGYATLDDREAVMAYGFRGAQARAPGLLVPVMWNKEEILHQFRPDDPRHGENGKPIKYETPMGSRMRLDCPPRVTADLADPSVDLWITEGVKKADAAASHGLCCIALLGVWNWRGTHADGTNGPLEDWDDVALAGRQVFVAFDSDAMRKPEVHAAVDALALFLAGRGAHIREVHLPEGDENFIDGSKPKVGLDDYLAAGGNAQDLVAAAQVPRLAVKTNGRSLPDLTRDAIAALAAANEPPVIFQRMETLAEARPIGVAALSKDRLRYRLSEAANWHKVTTTKEDQTKQTPVAPPMDVVTNVNVAADLWPFPVLDRIVTTPVFAEDGSLRGEPGYHAASRSLYVPPEGLVVPPMRAHPTRPEVNRARELVDDLLRDFVFVDDADKAHAVAMMLQPFARELIRGATPMYGVEAPKQGTGKTVLVNSVLAAAVGEVPSYAEPHGDDEMEKRLTASFLNADPVVFFDNVVRTFNYPSLASALTKNQWQGRVLGQSLTMQARILCTWVLTANNPQYSDDMARRVARVRLDAQMQDPHRRSNFAHSLPAYALQNRGDLIWAACTLIRAWVVKGRPAPPDTTPHLATYGPWRRVMGGILTLHDVPDFLGNLPVIGEDTTPEQEALEFICRVVVKRLRGATFTSADLLHYVEAEPDVAAVIQPGSRETLSQRLGKFFRAHKGQHVNGYRLERSTKRGSGGFAWQFVKVEDHV